MSSFCSAAYYCKRQNKQRDLALSARAAEEYAALFACSTSQYCKVPQQNREGYCTSAETRGSMHSDRTLGQQCWRHRAVVQIRKLYVLDDTKARVLRTTDTWIHTWIKTVANMNAVSLSQNLNRIQMFNTKSMCCLFLTLTYYKMFCLWASLHKRAKALWAFTSTGFCTVISPSLK